MNKVPTVAGIEKSIRYLKVFWKPLTNLVLWIWVNIGKRTLDIENTEAIEKNIELYKREDLRTDMTAISIIRLMIEIVKKNMDIDLHVVTYNVQPISKNSGFIGAINNYTI